MSLTHTLESLSDDEVLTGLDDLLRQSRRLEAPLVAHIGEVHARHLYARYAASSMFSYCTTVLHLSEGEAQLRIAVAKATREHPILLDMLADGRLHLSGIAKLEPILTPENREPLLARATHKTKREIEEMVAALAPRPDAPSVIRKLPERQQRAEPRPEDLQRVLEPLAHVVPSSLGTLLDADVDARSSPVEAFAEVEVASSPSRLEIPLSPQAPRRVFEPLSPARYKVQFTAGPELRDDLEALKALMRSEVPDGDLAAIVAKAVRQLRERLEARRFAQTRSPLKRTSRLDSSSRHVPAEIPRAVYRRDSGRCCFVDAQGRRCPERHGLEYHHGYPFGKGGSHGVDNICLMCPPHNRYLAELDYGKERMSRYWRSAREKARRPAQEIR